MQIIVPQRVYAMPDTVAGFHNLPAGKFRAVYPLDFHLEKAEGSFWCTTGRQQNDCVHAKVVDSPVKSLYPFHPSLLGGTGQTVNGDNFAMAGEGRHATFASSYNMYNHWWFTYEGESQDSSYLWYNNIGGQFSSIRSKGSGADKSYCIRAGATRCSYTRRRFIPVSDTTLDCEWVTIGFDIWGDGGGYARELHLVNGLCSGFDTSLLPSGAIAMVPKYIYDGWGPLDQVCLTALDWALRVLEPIIHLAIAAATHELARTRRVKTIYNVLEYERPNPKIGLSGFVLEEPELIQMKAYSSNYVKAYWRQWLKEHAYYDALDSAPVMSSNNLQNIGELCSFISNLVIHKRISMPRSLQDAWLAYRYSFNTTKSDVEEAIEFVHREMDLSCLDKAYIQLYGSSTTQVEGLDVTCKCTLKMRHKEVGYLQDLWYNLYKYGLAPNFYVIWDSLPYSFIVDWFIPMGDVFEVVDASMIYCGDTFEIKDVVFSLQYSDRDDLGRAVRYYSRWASKPLTSLNGLYWFDKGSNGSSDQTWFCRALDVASLIIS